MTGVPTDKKRFDRDTGERPCEDHTKMETEIGVELLPAKEYLDSPETRERPGTISLSLQKEPTLPTP